MSTIDIRDLSDDDFDELQLQVAIESARRRRVARAAAAAAEGQAKDDEPIPPPQAARELGVSRSTPHTWGVKLDDTGRAPRGVWKAARAARPRGRPKKGDR